MTAWLTADLTAAAVLILLRLLVWQPMIVKGRSMLPTLRNG